MGGNGGGQRRGGREVLEGVERGEIAVGHVKINSNNQII